VAIRLINQIDSLYEHEDFAKASQLIDNAISICEKLGLTAQLADLYRTKGDVYRLTDSYIKALEALSISLEYYQKLNNLRGIASIQNLMGAVYRLQGKYPAALEHYFDALKNYQSTNYKSGISVTQNNIGIVYLYQKDFDKALEYYFKSLELGLSLNDEESICISYLNIGGAYQKKKDYKNAIDFLLKSLLISKKIKDLDAVGVNYNEIGSIYTELNNLQQAKFYLDQALYTFKESGSKSRQTECHIYLGQYFVKGGNPEQAIVHLKEAVNLALATGSKEFYSNALQYLSEVYERINKPSLALKYYKDYISARDSLFNAENTKRSVQAELLYQFERKQETLKAEQAKKDAILIEKVKQQNIIRNLLIASLSLLTILIAFILSAYRDKQKANEILKYQRNEIVEKNEELLQQQEEILAQRDEIEKKNRILEHSQQIIAAKNERIISSIEYAQTIQQAILPHEDQLSKFFKDHFVVFLPKDIVSGDFFWFSADQDVVFAAVIDCTGHGVPGSFMSLIGNTLLNQIVNEWHTHDPALILEYLHQKIRKALQQNETHSKSHASMDVCFVKINLKTHKVTFAGANRPLYVVQDGTLVKISGDKKSVGGFQRESLHYYTNHEINLKSDSYFYLTTDGFVDQMNPDKRKFGPAQLLKLLEDNSSKPMNTQKEILMNMLEVYKQGEDQIDDICILGIKI
jgi:serine phosphatase RsbU (regulator of sigma subunit)